MPRTDPLEVAGAEQIRRDDVDAGGRHRDRRVGVVVGVLAVVFAAGLVLAWFRWGRFDPGVVGVHLSPASQRWYALLMFLSTVTVAIALATWALQLGRWLERRPRAYRYVWRCYVLGGVYPTVVLSLVVGVFWPFSAVSLIPQIAFYVLWTAVTTGAVVAGRRGRVEERRRWQVRSLVLAGTILVRLLIVEPLMGLLLGAELHTRLGGNVDALMQLKDSNVGWIGIVVALLVGEAILERRRARDLTPVP